MKIFLGILQKVPVGVVLACAAYASAYGAAVSWQNANSSSWNDPANWSSDPALPGPADSVTISVAGLITVNHDGGTNTVDSLTSTENLLVTAGVLTITNAYSNTADTSINGGALVLNGNSGSAGYSQSGGSLQGTGTLTVSGVATITGGDQQGAGSTILQGATTLSTIFLDAGRTLRNEGTLTQTSGTVYLNYNNSGGSIPGFGTITNAAGATWVASGDFNSNGISAPDFFGPTDPSTDASFTNQGTFRKSGSSAADVTNIGVVFNNSGTVDVQTGVLALNNGGTHTGSFTGVVGTLRFGGGTHSLSAASSITTQNVIISGGTVETAGIYNISGTTTVNGGSLNLTGATVNHLGSALELSGGVLILGGANGNVNTLSQSGGSLQGTGTLTVSGVATITGGDQQGTGSTILQGATTLSTIFLDAGRTLRNEGTLTQTSGTVYLNYNNSGGSIPGFGTITNAAGATWVALGDFNSNGIFAPDFFGPTDPSTDASFTNQGTFRKSGSSAADVTNIGVVFNNSGTVDVQTGVLALNNGGTHTGSFTGVVGTLRFGGGTHSLSAASSITTQNVIISGGTVETAGIYNISGTTTVNGGSLNLTGATVNHLGSALELSGGVLILGGANGNVNTLSQSGGSLQGTGTLTVSGVATITGGDQQGTGSTILQGATTLSTIFLDAGRTLRNEGTLTQTSGTVYLNYNNSGGSIPGFGTITNAAGATWVALGDFNSNGIFAPDFFGPTDPSTDASFTNQGTFRKSGSSAADVTNIGVVFNNSGTVDVQTGVLALNNGGTHTGSFATALGSTLQFGGGTHNLNNASAVNSLGRILISGGAVNTTGTLGSGGLIELQSGVLNAGGAINTARYTQSGGSLQGTGTLTVSGVATITGGDQQGAGSTILQGATALSTIYLDAGRTLRNEGTLTQTSGTVYLNYNINGISVPGFGTITNAAGATWVASGDFNSNGIFAPDFFGPTDPSTDASFTNQGTFRKSGSSAADVTNIGVVFNNSGTVDVQTGVLALNNGGTHTGSFATALGSTLQFGGGTHNLNNASAVNSLGRILISGGAVNTTGTLGSGGLIELQSGVLNAGGAINTARYTQSGGSLQGTGTLTVSGVATITGGDQQGAGSTILQGATALSTIYLDAGRTLRNEGTLTQTSGTVYLNYNINGISVPGFGTITNAAGATWVALGDFNSNGIFAPDFFGPTDPSTDASFTNQGTFRKSGSSAADVTNIGVVFNNSGTVEVQAGTLTLGSKFTNTGTARVQPLATLISNGTFTNFDSGTSTLTGGTYEVFGTSGSAGVLSFAGADIVTNAATILLDGPNSNILNYNTNGDGLANFAINAGSFTIENGRNFTTAAGFNNPGTVQIGPSSTFTSTGSFANGGTLAIRGGTFNALSLVNSGELNGHGTVNPIIQNGGSVRAFGGTLTGAGGISGNGVVQTDAGATLVVGAVSNAATLINNGNLVLGTSNITVANAYQNASFGVGNSFNRRANVTGTGQILAGGANPGTAQILAGDFSPTPTSGNALIDFGSLRVGDSVSRNYQIANASSGGPSLFGAIQTAVNGGSVTDTRLSGAGVTASNWGPIAPGNNTGNLGVTFAATSSGSLAGQQVHIQNNFDNTNSQNIAFQGKAYTPAVAQQNTTSVNFGIVHRGDPLPTHVVSVTNAAPVTALNDVLLMQSAGATAPFTSSGNLGAGLLAGQSNSTSLLVGLNTTNAGVFNGTATFTAASHNPDMADLPLPSVSVPLSGQVNNFAASAFSFSSGAGSFLQTGSIYTLDFGTLAQGSGTVAGTLLAHNSATGPADLLNGTFEFVGSQVFGTTGFNSFADLAAGQSFGPLTVSLDTSSAGVFSETDLAPRNRPQFQRLQWPYWRHFLGGGRDRGWGSRALDLCAHACWPGPSGMGFARKARCIPLDCSGAMPLRPGPKMLSKLQFGVALGFSVIALVLAILNAAISNGNRTLQIEVTGRNQYIQQSLQLEPLYQEVVRNLVEVAANHDDAQIRDLLVSQGITFKVNTPNKNADRTSKQ